MNSFRKWLAPALSLVVLAAGTSLLLVADRKSNGSDDWLVWWVLTTPLYATLGLGARSRPCRRPRWLGGR